MKPETYTCRLCAESYPWPDDIDELEADSELVCDGCFPALDTLLGMLEQADPEQVASIVEAMRPSPLDGDA